MDEFFNSSTAYIHVYYQTCHVVQLCYISHICKVDAMKSWSSIFWSLTGKPLFHDNMMYQYTQAVTEKWRKQICLHFIQLWYVLLYVIPFQLFKSAACITSKTVTLVNKAGAFPKILEVGYLDWIFQHLLNRVVFLLNEDHCY